MPSRNFFIFPSSRWTTRTAPAILDIADVAGDAMQHNGHAPHFDAIASDTALAPRCRTCASSASHALVDAYGAAICEACLRRIDADPREKRRLMFSMADSAYW